MTHILRQARRLADYVVFLYLGNLIEHGPAEEVLNRPKYAKTKAYLEGRFIEEPAVAREIDLRKLAGEESRRTLERAVRELGVNQVVRIVVEENHLQEVIASPSVAAHTVLELKKQDTLASEILLQKNEGAYSI